MSLQGWIIFASFWAVFVVTPGPNAVNCMCNGMSFGLRRGLWGVLAILTQATAFLLLSAYGISALLVASPTAFTMVKFIGGASGYFVGALRVRVGFLNKLTAILFGGLAARLIID